MTANVHVHPILQCLDSDHTNFRTYFDLKIMIHITTLRARSFPFIVFTQFVKRTVCGLVVHQLQSLFFFSSLKFILLLILHCKKSARGCRYCIFPLFAGYMHTVRKGVKKIKNGQPL